MRRSCCGAQPRNAACSWPGAFLVAEMCHEFTSPCTAAACTKRVFALTGMERRAEHRLQKHQSASRSSDTHTDVVSAMQVEAQLASVLRIGAA